MKTEKLKLKSIKLNFILLEFHNGKLISQFPFTNLIEKFQMFFEGVKFLENSFHLLIPSPFVNSNGTTNMN